MAGADDVVKAALKLIAGGAKEAGPSVAERAAKNIDVFNTANRLGVDTNDIAKLQETKRLMDYHKGFMGDVRERAQSLAELQRQMQEQGAFPMEVGTRFTTPHSQKFGHPPHIVTGYYVDPKNPSGRYGYRVRQEHADGNVTEQMLMIRDPKLEALHGPEKWEELQRGFVPMTGPKVVKASGGSIRQGYQTKGRVVGDIVDQALKLIAGSDPQKTVKAYKLFKQREGKLYPLFVDANEEVPLNQWLKAKAGEQAASGQVKSKAGPLAYRPGWHAGDLPTATHIGAKSHGNKRLPPDTRRSDEVWAEVEMADDVDWQKLANERARITKKGTPDPKTAHITDQVPYGGFYRYKTSPTMQGNWMIGGDMRVNRVLTDDEVKAINEAAGVADLPRREGYGPGGWVDDVVKMAGKVISGEGDDAAKAGIRAYHGSPHDFDRFDMSKIGTGEGAQAYGHGLYFAEREGIAKGYRDALSSNKFSYGNVRPDDEAIQKFSNQLSDIERRKAGLADKDGFISLDASADDLASLQAEEDKVRNMMVMDTINRNPHLQYGRMYEVNINADPDAFLDWDKPLSEQPEAVRSALTSFGVIKNIDKMKSRIEMLRQAGQNDAANEIEASLPHYEKMLSQTGDELHQRMFHEARRELGGQGGAGAYQAQVAEKLREAGIPGIKYLDAGSRGAGDGTRNYVVFDDKLISIIRKYGIAGASAMLGYNLMEQLDPKQALAASMADQDYQASRPQRSMGGNNSISGALNVARGLYGDR